METERVLVTGRLDNPYVKVHGVPRAVLECMVETNREWELSHKQRIAVRHRPSGAICGALVLYREHELFPGPYPDTVRADQVAARFFQANAE